ncbi:MULTISPECIES: SRPBCC family protein [Sphingomonas]|uniref:SRPBCC family protein n=1 Tax=Sphingomonas lycopersici TaxID=2951807 RepID=A0AA41Z9X1_9SPHN|nr:MULTISPECIES: SRPBCC family protein [Sphingomonas]MCW6529906.1 SRPBCC family protein [Sphingomonas lycopersici]MCW6535291.1 SRPBCC family protein [Sphingomonas lycopersici]
MADRITAHELRFERLLAAPLDRVWQYLVDPELRARWFMGGPTDLRPGGTIGMTMAHDNLSDEAVPTPARYAEAIGKTWSERILRVEPPHLLAFTWSNGEAGEVTITLAAEAADKTRLVLEHTGLRGREDAANFGGGWGAHLDALERRVAGEGVADFWKLHAEAEQRAEAALEAA